MIDGPQLLEPRREILSNTIEMNHIYVLTKMLLIQNYKYKSQLQVLINRECAL